MIPVDDAPIDLPPLARYRRSVPQPVVDDPAARVRQCVLESRLARRVRPGGSVALGVGSRGVTDIHILARAAVNAIRELGFQPFIIPAMGSHGGATPEGQLRLLADYGVTPEAMGVEIRAEMDTERVGVGPHGLPIHFDRRALRADGLVLLNRVKPHTDFHAPHESGILKMLVVGLGKRDGAARVHRLGLRGLKEVLPAVGRTLVRETPFALGIAVVENAAHKPAIIDAIEPEDLFEAEPRLLDRARELMARLPFDRIDVLVVGELGKNYSGSGMDPNVLGRLMIETQPDFPSPVVTRLAVLDVSDESHGNAVGTGFADVVTERLVSRVDPDVTRLNLLTACFLERGRMPIAMPHDRAVLDVCLRTCWRLDPTNEARLVVIPNTLELDTLWISPPLAEEAAADPRGRLDPEFRPVPFLEDGVTLDQERLFPESVRARRRARA